MPALEFIRETLLNSRSPACWWRHPLMAARLVGGVLGNAGLDLRERVLPSGRRECPVCGWRGRDFRTFVSADEVIRRSICPSCGSFDRHRQLVLGVREELDRIRARGLRTMVGFSLSTALRFLLESEGLARCFRTDIAVGDDRFAPDLVADLRRTPFTSGTVDWVFCSHVLEHIPELEICVNEILRILKPGGTAWIQVPFEPGLVHSRRIPVDLHRAHAHAWQFAPDFGTHLERPEWTVTEVVAGEALDAAGLELHGIDPRERFWTARKDG